MSKDFEKTISWDNTNWRAGGLCFQMKNVNFWRGRDEAGFG